MESTKAIATAPADADDIRSTNGAVAAETNSTVEEDDVLSVFYEYEVRAMYCFARMADWTSPHMMLLSSMKSGLLSALIGTAHTTKY